MKNQNCQKKSADEIEKNAEERYHENVHSFIKKNGDSLAKANQMRKDFERTLKYNDHEKHFYKELADVKVMILTANETERETLFSYFTIYPSCSDVVKNNVVIRIPYDGLEYSFFYINDIKVVHVEPEMTGSDSKGGTAQTLRKALERVKPSVVISVGVGFGCDIDKETLCDVLVGRQYFSYDKSVKIRDKEITVKRLHLFEADESLLYKMKSAVLFEDQMTGIFENRFKAHMGNIITGEYVVDSKIFRDLIFAPFKPFGVIGGEMESFGLFSGIEEYNRKNPKMKTRGIMIKGICDWGVGKNADSSENKIDSSDDDITEINWKESESDVNTYDCFSIEEGTSIDNQKKKTKWQITEDDKNNLQVLAMCNACTVCKKFLKDENFLSDYKIYGKRKCRNRCYNKIRKKICKKNYCK